MGDSIGVQTWHCVLQMTQLRHCQEEEKRSIVALMQGFSISFSEVPLCLYLIREVPLSNYSVANIVSGASYGWGPGARLRAPVGSRGEAPGSQRVFTV